MRIEDLQPKPFTINVKGVELQCKPLKLSHALMVAKTGQVLENVASSTTEQIKQAEKDLEVVLTEVISELKDIELDADTTFEIIEKLMEHVQPEENRELKEQGVTFDDPKAETTG